MGMRSGFERELRRAISGNAMEASGVGTMLAYALFPGGKRLRPLLTLLLAEAYGSKKSALGAALAIELFHNFTLIHDDIEDGDSVRRNKSTLWKKYSVNLALNAGDALSIAACKRALRSPAKEILLAAFAEVIEGQHMDLAGIKTIQECMTSMEKKTGALFGAAAESAGACTKQSKTECKTLREFGRAFGTAFQLADDYHSIWSTQAATRKDALSDIRERKRTLPFFFASQHNRKLEKFYRKKVLLKRKEMQVARAMFDASDARLQTLREIRTHVAHASKKVSKLRIGKKARAILSQLVDALVPKVVHENT